MMIEKAKKFAEKAHEGQKRKSGHDFIEHPYAVADILIKGNVPDEVVCAGYLHDTIEDTFVTAEMILEEFGEKIHSLVMSNTEDKSKTWIERKMHTIHEVPFLSLDERCLIIADKLANVTDLKRDLHLGEDLWKRFNAPYESQKAYYVTISLLSEVNLSEEDKQKVPAYFAEYKELVKEVFSK